MTLAFPKPTKAPKRRREPTAAESAYMARVAMLPCCVCGCIPVECHHPRQGVYSGSAPRAPHWHVIPLCDRHHQGKFDIRGPAFHKGKETWSAFTLCEDWEYIAETQAKVEAEFFVTVPAEFRILSP